MLRRYTHGGSALDLREAAGSQTSVTSAPVRSTHESLLRTVPSTPIPHRPGKLRRVLTAHVRRNSHKKQNKNFSLRAMLKEPLRLVNSVPLNFDYSSYAFLLFGSRHLITLLLMFNTPSMERSL
ncbi:uncharacterized protein LOC111266509 [Varroa jacobsoni]|uniref:uncharacterized protein LOC111266509 n=1 Tax=Varroa jacobsoni TaxID=62625 RepID=UPI000BF30931|nr:uncharacterized protein LOC111266509 [Varroa jacobsoni]